MEKRKGRVESNEEIRPLLNWAIYYPESVSNSERARLFAYCEDIPMSDTPEFNEEIAAWYELNFIQDRRDVSSIPRPRRISIVAARVAMFDGTDREESDLTDEQVDMIRGELVRTMDFRKEELSEISRQIVFSI